VEKIGSLRLIQSQKHQKTPFKKIVLAFKRVASRKFQEENWGSGG
jgi:hypothetical protein